MVDDAGVKERIEAHLDHAASGRLARYFFGPKPSTGRRFERFAGGGDRPEVAHHFTAEDFVAVSMLSVQIPGASAIEILETKAEDLNELLTLIPAELDLWDAERNMIGRESPTWILWRELARVHQVGEPTASKLLARKRPRLVPVYEPVVAEALGDPYDWWAAYHAALQHGLLRDRLEEIRAQSNVGSDISLLRVLDVAIETAHQNDRLPDS
jgi:Family of unknown function (DUF6308)